jgi:hypothetical protein
MGVAPTAERRTSGNAIAALVLGICGLVVFPLIGVLAIVFGYRARDEIRRDPTVGGDGLATAGIILGWIATVLVALGLLFVILFLAAF